jgi:branched-chain amino acid aminotransferase
MRSIVPLEAQGRRPTRRPSGSFTLASMDPSSHIWSDGELVPWEEANVHFLSHGLQYGTGVFEGIRAYATPEGPAVFRLREHMERLVASADAYGFARSWDTDQLVAGCLDLLRRTGLESAYIRPMTFYAEGSVGLYPSDNRLRTMIAAFNMGPYLGHGSDQGIRAMVSSWRRISHTSLIPTAKGSGGYLNSMLAKGEALRAGYDEAILLNDSGSVSEGSGMNLFLVSDGVLLTPPVSAGILEGLTRNSIMSLAAREGVDSREVDMARGALYTADEILLTGTAIEVTPVVEIDGKTVGSGKPGPITRKVQELYGEAVMGKLDEFRHWLTYV